MLSKEDYYNPPFGDNEVERLASMLFSRLEKALMQGNLSASTYEVDPRHFMDVLNALSRKLEYYGWDLEASEQGFTGANGEIVNFTTWRLR